MIDGLPNSAQVGSVEGTCLSKTQNAVSNVCIIYIQTSLTSMENEVKVKV